MAAPSNQGTCLICSHAIGNHAWDGFEQYQCQLCPCIFKYVSHSAYITVVKDANDYVAPDTRIMIEGSSVHNPNLSPDAPIVTNAQGGSQSQLDLRFDLLDTKAMFRLASILNYGANKYGDNNWRNIPTRDHINHALTHIFAYLQNDQQDDHLGHAFCRLMMALGTEKEE